MYLGLQESVMKEVATQRWGDFKPRLADALVEHLAPIRTNYAEIMKVQLTAIRSDVFRRRLVSHPVVEPVHAWAEVKLFHNSCSIDFGNDCSIVPMQDEAWLTEVLAKGAASAEKVANRTVENCRQAMGFLPR